MKRLLIFTAGISLLENLTDPTRGFGQQAGAENFRHMGSDAWSLVLRRQEALRDELSILAKPFSCLDLANSAELSRSTAEIASFYLLCKDNPGSEDRLVLLCSDTGEGAFCGLINAMLLGKQVNYCDDKAQRSFTIPGFSQTEMAFNPALLNNRLAEVELRVVKGLYPTKPDKFEKTAIPALVGTIAKLHYNSTPDTQTVLNYSGGFKAAIPTLTQAAAVAGNIELVCLYEDATDLVRLPLIQIHLAPEAENHLLWAGENDAVHLDVLNSTHSFNTLEALPRTEWAFYRENAGGGLKCSSLGLAMQKLLRARERWSEMTK